MAVAVKIQRVLKLDQVADALVKAHKALGNPPVACHLNTCFTEAVEEMAKIGRVPSSIPQPRIIVPGLPKAVRFELTWAVLEGAAVVVDDKKRRCYVDMLSSRVLYVEPLPQRP
jgi:hypothetical protein